MPTEETGDLRASAERDGGPDRDEQEQASERQRLSPVTVFETIRREGADELERPVLARLHALPVARAQAARQLRQQHDADGDADDAERQLVDTVGEVERGHGARLSRRDCRTDQRVDLRYAAGDGGR